MAKPVQYTDMYLQAIADTIAGIPRTVKSIDDDQVLTPVDKRLYLHGRLEGRRRLHEKASDES